MNEIDMQEAYKEQFDSYFDVFFENEREDLVIEFYHRVMEYQDAVEELFEDDEFRIFSQDKFYERGPTILL